MIQNMKSPSGAYSITAQTEGDFLWKICKMGIWIHKIFTAICRSGQAERYT